MTRITRGVAALAGLAAGAVTIGLAEVLAGLLVRATDTLGTPSPLLAVGEAFVDLTPAWLKELAIATFGTADKIALFVGMGLVLVAVCAGLGILARHRTTAAVIGFAAVGVLAVIAVFSRPGSGLSDALPTVVGTALGAITLARLTRATTAAAAEPDGDPSRRSVLVGGTSLTVVGVLGIVAGRVVSGAGDVVRMAREAFVVPRVPNPVSVPEGADPA